MNTIIRNCVIVGLMVVVGCATRRQPRIVGRWQVSETDNVVMLAKDHSAQLTSDGKMIIGSYEGLAPDLLKLTFPAIAPQSQERTITYRVPLDLRVGRLLTVITDTASKMPPTPPTQSHPEQSPQSQAPRNQNLIAHIKHGGLSFSIAIDHPDASRLRIIIPEKMTFTSFSTSARPSVRLRVVMRDDKIVEGDAKENSPYSGSGGWLDVAYVFSLGRQVTAHDIHSVTLWIGDQEYTALPF